MHMINLLQLWVSFRKSQEQFVFAFIYFNSCGTSAKRIHTHSVAIWSISKNPRLSFSLQNLLAKLKQARPFSLPSTGMVKSHSKPCPNSIRLCFEALLNWKQINTWIPQCCCVSTEFILDMSLSISKPSPHMSASSSPLSTMTSNCPFVSFSKAVSDS